MSVFIYIASRSAPISVPAPSIMPMMLGQFVPDCGRAGAAVDVPCGVAVGVAVAQTQLD